MSALVVMGVSGSGKSTVGRLVAHALGHPFAEGDDFHPASSVAKMSAGTALTDADRRPWLQALRAWLAEHPDGVLTCSALRRDYRDVLRPAVFVDLQVPPEVLLDRVTRRTGHWMSASLLPSQLDLLEPLEPDEDGFSVDATRDPEDVVAEVLRRLAGR